MGQAAGSSLKFMSLFPDLWLQLSCDPDRMTFRVLVSALQELNINISVLHLSNPGCNLLDTSGVYASVTLTHENHTQCGTVVKVKAVSVLFFILGSCCVGCDSLRSRPRSFITLNLKCENKLMFCGGFRAREISMFFPGWEKRQG